MGYLTYNSGEWDKGNKIMAQFKIETKADSLVIIHLKKPKFEAMLGGEDGNWISRIEWIDEASETDKQKYINAANQWYEDQIREGQI